MNTNPTTQTLPEVENKALKRAKSLGMPILEQLLTGLDPEAALSAIESVIIRQVIMPDTNDRWDTLLSQQASYKSQQDTGLLAFWIDANDSIPSKEQESFRIERFDRGMAFLEKLIHFGLFGENPQRDKALRMLLSYALESFELSHQKSFDGWQRFLCIGSFRPEVCAQSVHDQIKKMSMPVETAFWLMDNLCEYGNDMQYSEGYGSIRYTRILVARQLSWIIWHKGQQAPYEYMSRARLLHFPMMFVSGPRRSQESEPDREFSAVQSEDVYEACHGAVREIVVAANAFNAVERECMDENCRYEHGVWGTYLEFEGMRFDPKTFDVTEVVFRAYGKNPQFGGWANDIRLDVVNNALAEAGERLRLVFEKAGIGISKKRPVRLRASVTLPLEGKTKEEQATEVAQSYGCTYWLY